MNPSMSDPQTPRNAMPFSPEYGEQARHYVETLRERIDARPLQSVGMAWGAGVVFNKVFGRRPAVRVVKTSVPAPSLEPARPDAALRQAEAVPLRMRLALERLAAKSQEYGSLARAGVQAHPLIGMGSVLGLSALLTTFWLQRRRPPASTAYVAVDEKGHGVAWGHDPSEVAPSARAMLTSRPVTFAAVLLGVGAVAGAMLKRR